jgi:hypothetical protein
MKKTLHISIISLVLLFSCFAFSFDEKKFISVEQVNTQCLSKKWQKQNLQKLKENKFTLENKVRKEALALQLLHCLAHPDTNIRDGIAFDALSFWLRTGQLSEKVQLDIYHYLTNVIASEVYDSDGVYQTFSILMLSEVARVDRKIPFLTDVQRDYLVTIGTDFLFNLRDYRGFSTKVGWRHGVAHSSDLMLQLALNPAITKTHLDKMLKSLASQITAHEQHYYINGEPKRIAMAVIYIFLRGEHSGDYWNNWLKSVTDSSPFNQWQDVYQSEQGLIKLHNTQSFLYALYATIKPSKNKVLTEMSTYLEQVIKATK